MNAELPNTIAFDLQPYGCVTLGNLHWGTEIECGIHRTVLRGTVIEGRERGYLFGHVSSRDVTGEHRTVYGVTAAEIKSGRIVRVAM
jgi:hypothetical protein